MIKLYSTGCPKCKVLKKKLEASGKEFEVIESLDEINKVAEELDIHEAPFVIIGDQVLNFAEANRELGKI